MTDGTERAKCACGDCVCTVGDGSVTRDGQVYCGEACADHHAHGKGCGHAGCDCHG